MQRGVLYCPSSAGILCSKIFVFFSWFQSSIISTMDRRRICVSLSCIPLNPGFPRSSCTCTRAGNCRWTLWLWFWFCACRRRRSFLPPNRIFVGIPPGDFPGGRRTSMPRSKASRRIPGRCGRWQRGRRRRTIDHGISLVALDGFQTS